MLLARDLPLKAGFLDLVDIYGVSAELVHHLANHRRCPAILACLLLGLLA